MFKKFILVLSLISVTSCVQSIPLDQEKETEITIQNIKNPKSKLMRFFNKHKLLIEIGVASVVSLAAGATLASFYYKNKTTETELVNLDMLEKQKAIVDKTPRQINELDNPLYQPEFDVLNNLSHLFESQAALEKLKYSIELEKAAPEKQTSLNKKILELEIKSKETALNYRFPSYVYGKEFLEKKAAEIKELKQKLQDL